jgi:hypothetical protein
MRDVDDVLGAAGEVIDFGAPVALMFVACLHHLEDQDDPAGLVGKYLDALAPGSYLVLSHITHESDPEAFSAGRADARRSGMSVQPRGRDAIARLFNGRTLLDPGLVLVSGWRPENGHPDPNAAHVNAYGGVAAL